MVKLPMFITEEFSNGLAGSSKTSVIFIALENVKVKVINISK